ncbi:hypothetical protein [Polaribacter sp. Hel_I_88]|uniref:rolling circle replication-associated protein n=1 Tax=Polaribacter sp. Hel_I_88 TaxID=1250006 RepID=UPI000A56CB25|nr:hypothetical protein [Polaribacter sp. Hel_I_88]
MLQTSVNVISVRNNSLVQYRDNSFTKGNTNGTKNTLKQNTKSHYLTNLNNLISIDNFENINEHTSKIQLQYDNHKREILLHSCSQLAISINNFSKDYNNVTNLKVLGTMSEPQIKKVRRCLETMTSLVLMNYDKRLIPQNQKYLTFVTLTLPTIQKHSDKLLRKCLTRFIENLQKTYNVVHYVWKAETQKNGNIHFHLLTDMWIDKDDVRRLWNKQIENLGYITEYSKNRQKKGFIYHPTFNKKGILYKHPLTKIQQLANYNKEKQNGFRNPNTTDIHSLKNVQNTTNYLMKYLTKSEPDKRPVIGAIWGASNLTKKLEYPTFYESEIAFDALINLIKSNRLKTVLSTDFFSVHVGKIYDIIKKDYRKLLWNSVKLHFKKLATYTKETYKNFSSFAENLKTQINESNEYYIKQKEFEKKQLLDEQLKEHEKRIQLNIFGFLDEVPKVINNNLKKITCYLSHKKYLIDNKLIPVLNTNLQNHID